MKLVDLDKQQLLEAGKLVAAKFCELNDLEMPAVDVRDRADWPFNVCAYYRAGVITICLEKCASIGRAGMAWSYPGYVVDRTPYGVIAHELGHHVDHGRGAQKGSYFSNYSAIARAAAAEDPITSYCPNDAEWFAEIFRLFITNPDLLRRLRPRTYELLLNDRHVPAFYSKEDCQIPGWRVQLKDAPARTIAAAENKISQAERAARK